MNKIYSLSIFILTSLSLSGCAVGLAGAGATTAYVATQEVSPAQQAIDLQIKAKIKDAMIYKNPEYLTDVQVSVTNGQVLLIGSVEYGSEKMIIEEIVKKIPNVKSIHNKIRAYGNYSILNYLNDSLISNAIRARIIASKHTYLTRINVEVFNNIVYLAGIVSSDQEKIVAENIARTGKGVVRVYSFLSVNNNPTKKQSYK